MGYYDYYDHYDYGYNYPQTDASVAGVVGALLGFAVVLYLLLLAFLVVNYVLYSLGVYKIAKRRGIHHPWLSWLPIGNVWVLGSISDQYQYVAKGRVRNRRKVLLGLEIALFAVCVLYIGSAVAMIFENMGTVTGDAWLGVTVAGILLAYLAMTVLAIVLLVFEYIALYDLFASCDPGNAVLFLVLTICLGVVLPFFVFACRNKDLGMPPRKPVQPVYQPIQPPVEPLPEVEETEE